MAMNLSKDGNVVRRSLPLLRAGPPGPLVRDDDDTVEGYSPSFVTVTDELQNRNSASEVSFVGLVVGADPTGAGQMTRRGPACPQIDPPKHEADPLGSASASCCAFPWCARRDSNPQPSDP